MHRKKTIHGIVGPYEILECRLTIKKSSRPYASPSSKEFMIRLRVLQLVLYGPAVVFERLAKTSLAYNYFVGALARRQGGYAGSWSCRNMPTDLEKLNQPPPVLRRIPTEKLKQPPPVHLRNPTEKLHLLLRVPICV